MLSSDSSGGLSCVALASTCDYVVFVCPTLAAAKAARAVFSHFNLTNTGIVVSSVLERVFVDESFTHICLHDYPNELFDSTAQSSSLLDGLERCLEQGGQLYISRQYQEPEHLLRRLLGQEPYSVPRQLKKSGNIEHYGNFELPPYIRFFDRFDIRALKYRIRGENTASVFSKVIPTGLAGVQLIDQIQQHATELLNIDIGPCQLIRIGSGASLVGEFQSAIARIPQSPKALARCTTNFVALKQLADMGLSVSIPGALCEIEVNGEYVFLESRVDGYSLEVYPELAVSHTDRIHEDGRQFLLSEKCRMHAIDASFFDESILPRLHRIKQLIGAQHQSDFERLTQMARRVLLRAQIPLVVEHGDFKQSNFLVDKSSGRLISLVDWDRASIPGLPLRDYLYFMSFGRDGSIVSAIKYMFSCSQLDALGKDHRYYTEELGIEGDTFRMLSFLAGIRTLTDFYDPDQDTRNASLKALITSSLLPALTWLVSASD